MTVYLDVLLLENIIMNFIIIAVTSYFSKIKASLGRILFGAVIGALCVLTAFYPKFEVYFTLFTKFLVSLIIIAVTFWPERLKDFIRLTLLFYFVSFVFGGAGFGLFYLLNSEGNLYNGIFYISGYPLKMLLMAAVVGFIVVKLSWDFVKGKLTKENIMVPISIKVEDKTVSVNSLIDTGNSLRDPISDLPVVVVEYEALKDLLPEEIYQLFSRGIENDLVLVSRVMENSNWISRFRLIPFSSLGEENGMLIGFKPDSIKIGNENQKKDCKNVIIGIYGKRFSIDKSYEALLSLDLVS